MLRKRDAGEEKRLQMYLKIFEDRKSYALKVLQYVDKLAKNNRLSKLGNKNADMNDEFLSKATVRYSTPSGHSICDSIIAHMLLDLENKVNNFEKFLMISPFVK